VSLGGCRQSLIRVRNAIGPIRYQAPWCETRVEDTPFLSALCKGLCNANATDEVCRTVDVVEALVVCRVPIEVALLA